MVSKCDRVLIFMIIHAQNGIFSRPVIESMRDTSDLFQPMNRDHVDASDEASNQRHNINHKPSTKGCSAVCTGLVVLLKKEKKQENCSQIVLILITVTPSKE